MSGRLWKVAVNAPLPEALTYQAPENLEIKRGQLVKVPLGSRRADGLVLGPAEAPATEMKIKSIESIDTDYEPLSEEMIRWLEWTSKYYIHPPGPTALLAYPPLGRKGERKTRKSPVVPTMAPSVAPVLTDEQRVAVDGILKSEGFAVHLLFGVTGSGKTEVYLQLLEKTLAQGKTGLVLVPEISLTPQLVQRFAARFGDQIASIHSQLTDRERTNHWWDMVEGRKKILIGARSALFCPIPNLGMIIVDEEHEPSFKQDEKLKYNGRDAAVMRAHLSKCPIVLGSATPSIETWSNALEGKYKLHTLKNRVAGRSLPNIEIVDLRATETTDRNKKTGAPFWMTTRLSQAMEETLGRGEQAALFLNRRGMAHMVVCPACGHTRQCPNCDINLTLHADSHLICHYCDYHENLKTKCQDCHQGQVEIIGLGTELLEKDLKRLFPDKRIFRADRDEISNRQELEDFVERMEKNEIDILVGTQMIAKGLDFPNLKLVGLVLADVSFNLPDFRATERSFQLITQMAGRSGRHIQEGESPGTVIVQTFNTEHESLKYAIAHDYEGFSAMEINDRKALNYPPAGKLVSFRIQAPQLQVAKDTALRLGQRARALQTRSENYQHVQILGPAEAALAKLRNQFRFQLLVKGPRADLLNAFTRQLIGDSDWIPNGARVLVDVDPIHLL